MVPQPHNDGFPSIAWCARLGGPRDDAASKLKSYNAYLKNNCSDSTLFDVRFWPWPDEGEEESIFAVTGGRDTFVCRTKQDADPPFDVLRWWREDESYSLNSICWTKDEAGNPLLCAAGSTPKSIIIYSVVDDAKIRTIPGHGRAINDLQISPSSPSILASASEDYSVRLWNLSPQYASQPCIAILAGQGHRQPLLTLDFHPNGHWLLSGGMDTAVALWAIPPLQNPSPEPRQISYPAFISEEVHTNYVDCVKSYGDLILSRSARGQTDSDLNKNEILLWRIDGFSSTSPPPSTPSIPYPGKYTRSAFPHSARSRGFQRLLTFDIRNTPRFYLRFGLFFEPHRRPILVMATEKSRFLFWDLQRCEQGDDAESRKPKKSGRGRPPKGGSISAESLSRLGGGKGRETSVASDSTSAFPHQPARSSTSLSGLPATNASRSASHSLPADEASYSLPGEERAATEGGAGEDRAHGTSTPRPPKRTHLDDPFKPLKPHHELVANTSLSKKEHFACAQVGWSGDGRWCVGVGDRGMVCVLRR